MRESAASDAKRPGESEVGELDASMNVDEKILRFEITMDNSVTVAVRQTLQQLVQVTLHTQWHTKYSLCRIFTA